MGTLSVRELNANGTRHIHALRLAQRSELEAHAEPAEALTAVVPGRVAKREG